MSSVRFIIVHYDKKIIFIMFHYVMYCILLMTFTRQTMQYDIIPMTQIYDIKE